MNRLPILLLVLLAFTTLTLGQEQSGMVKSANGILVVWNEPDNYFTIEIKGNKIVPAQQPLMFQVDGVFFQIQTVEKKAFLKKGDKDFDNKAILSAHRDWEGDYISGVIGKKLKIDSAWLNVAGMDALAWSYDMPKIREGQSAKRQLYLAVVKREHVLLLNAAVTANDDEGQLQKLLADVMASLKSSDKPLSLKAASEQVMKQN